MRLLLAQWDVLLAALPTEDSARVKRFLRESDRKLALGSRLLQLALMREIFGLTNDCVRIQRTADVRASARGGRL